MDAVRAVVLDVGMEPDEAAAMAAVAHRLRRRFGDLPVEEIEQAMRDAEHGYDGRPIRRFIPILVERDVIEVLSRRVPGPRPEVSRSRLPAPTVPA